MLTARKDSGTGNKLALYWDDGRGKKLVPLDKHEDHWGKEVKRLKAALQYEVAKREAITDELEQVISTNQAMLKLADTMINAHRQPI